MVLTGTHHGAQRAASWMGEAYRSVARFLARRSLARAALAVPRTVRFMGRTVRSGEVADAVSAPALSFGFAAGVVMDEALLAVAMTPNRFPRRADYARVSQELADARRMYVRRGWLARPDGYHRAPPALDDDAITSTKGWAMGLSYERITFDSGYAPHRGEPGGERWESYQPNHRAVATILRHADEPRPWVVGVHGFCMGYPFMDFFGLQAAKLHRDLGYNVVLPVLPLHGPRKVTRISGELFLSFDLMNTVHGMAQSLWDIRRLLSWIRAQGAPSIVLYGVSLGAYVVSLVTGFEDGLDAVVAGIPVADFPRLFHEHSPVHIRARAIEHRILGGTAEDVFRVVSPLSFTPRVPWSHRTVFAGYGDRMAFPEQARLLWEHWDRPSITWYPGNHVGYLWSRQVDQTLDAALARPGESIGALPSRAEG